MCEFWTCLVDRTGKVWWDASTSSHEELVKKSGWKDNKLKDRDFVRLEIYPKTQAAVFSNKRKDWVLKVDEEATLPAWFVQERRRWERNAWSEWEKALRKTLWKLKVAPVKRFINSLPKIKWLSFSGKVKTGWHISYGKNKDAAWDAARDAARDAAWDAAWDAAGDAARDAAWDAARDAAGDAARDAAGDAARDAELFARCLLVEGKITKKHFNHAKERMEVWKRGYGLWCDVNGKLYVYGIKKKKKRS